MNTLLMIIAGVLGLVSMSLFFNAKEANQGINHPAKPARDFYFKLLVIIGVLVSFGGFFQDWMLWAGIICSELGCIGFGIGLKNK